MAYYVNGASIDNNIGIAKCTSAAINNRFKGMNVLTTLDPLSTMAAGFEAYSASPLLGYAWSGTQINYVQLSTLKRNINNTPQPYQGYSIDGVITLSNTLPYPRVYYVMFQAAGGAGGNPPAMDPDREYQPNAYGGGGGSGYHTLTKVILQPGSSFSVTHSTTMAMATCKLLTGTAYMNGGYRTAGYSFSITASAGSPGIANIPGAGFRSGGTTCTGSLGSDGGSGILANALSHDGYSYPATAIYGGSGGQSRDANNEVRSTRRSEDIGYFDAAPGGGGGASVGIFLHNYGSPLFRQPGGGGCWFFQGGRWIYYIPATAGLYGSGGGGGSGKDPGAPGGPAYSIVFY